MITHLTLGICAREDDSEQESAPLEANLTDLVMRSDYIFVSHPSEDWLPHRFTNTQAFCSMRPGISTMLRDRPVTTRDLLSELADDLDPVNER